MRAPEVRRDVMTPCLNDVSRNELLFLAAFIDDLTIPLVRCLSYPTTQSISGKFGRQFST